MTTRPRLATATLVACLAWALAAAPVPQAPVPDGPGRAAPAATAPAATGTTTAGATTAGTTTTAGRTAAVGTAARAGVGGEARTTSLEPVVADADVTVRYVVTTRGRVGDVATFARTAADILTDPRGWSLGGSVAFVAVDDPAEADVEVVLASPAAVAEAADGCSQHYSCRIGDEVLINARNWRSATAPWRAAGGGLSDYRRYVVNHEVGHHLGSGHRDCDAPGAAAPVMLQQSMGLDGCEPHPWPLDPERAEVADHLDVAVRGEVVAEAERLAAGVPDVAWSLGRLRAR